MISELSPSEAQGPDPAAEREARRAARASVAAKLAELETAPVVAAEPANADRDAQRERHRRRLLVAELQRAGAPLDAAEFVCAGDLEVTAAIDAVRGGFNVIAVLGGSVGAGKTIAAVDWLRDAVADPGRWFDGKWYWGDTRPMLFVSAPALARWPRYDAKEMARLLQASRLVIDDLGVEFADAGGSFQATLEEVIADRIANRRLTILSTNLDAPNFKARYGERIADRIRQSGRFVSVAGPSLRVRLASTSA